MNLRVLIITILGIAIGSGVLAQPQTSRINATVERPVEGQGRGPRKLRVDLPLLSRAQPFVVTGGSDGFKSYGLADLRLFDAQGREVGYLLVEPPSERPTLLTGTVRPILPTEKTSGFELDLAQVQSVDMLQIEGLPPPFMKRAAVEGSGDGTRWSLVGQVTLFDLPDERLRQTSVGFMKTPYRYLRVTWDDANSARLPLPRRVTAREALRRTPPVPERAPVEIVRRPSEPGRSRYRVRLPAKGLPIVALALDAGAADVFRTATVTESRFNGERADPSELGRAQLVRSATGPATGALLRIAMHTPQSSDLQLTIEDGNNAPLDIKQAFVEFATLPWIYFEAPDGPLIARYGDAAARAPQYDLEAKRASIDLDLVPEAVWGEPRITAKPMQSVAVPGLPDRGAHIDVTGFRYQRQLPARRVDADGPVLVALKLDAAVLAHSVGPERRFADLRIVDDQDNQIPYVLERRDEPLSLDLQIRPASPHVASLTDRTQGNRSIYAIAMPYDTLPNPRLVIETSDRVFRRPVQIGVERAADRRRRDPWFEVLSSTVWQHADQESSARPLDASLGRASANEALVVVEEGDNRPLTLTVARVLLPSWRVRFFQPSVPLRLVYGHDETRMPQYDLALLAPAVMGADVAEIEAGPEAAGAPKPPPLLTPRMFWIGLGVDRPSCFFRDSTAATFATCSMTRSRLPLQILAICASV
jgi:Protein of unknown function (DUF3999)